MAQGKAAVVKLAFLIGAALLTDWTNYSIDRNPIDLETQAFPSPDKTQIAKFESNDDGWIHLKVKNIPTGKVDDSAQAELTPIFSVQWARDSKTILTIGHIAHGSAATLFHQHEGHWEANIVSLPDEDSGQNVYRVINEVVKADMNEHDVIIHYEVGVQIRSSDEDFEETDFAETVRVDPRTNKLSVLSRTRI